METGAGAVCFFSFFISIAIPVILFRFYFCFVPLSHPSLLPLFCFFLFVFFSLLLFFSSHFE